MSLNWKKLGQIFDPADWNLMQGAAEFAQSPQALVLNDRVRIYFSTRSREPGTKNYLSHIAYVDMRKDFREVMSVSSHTVLALGGKACFDEHGIFPMNVVRNKDSIYAYTSGVNRRASVPVDTAIGFAVSCDEGRTFQRIGDGPVLAASLHEPFLVADPFVQIFNDVFHMWYIFGSGWKRFASNAAPDRIYKIAHATSSDGIHWAKKDGEQVVESVLGPEECQALPTVIEIAGVFHMFFCYRYADDFRTNPDRGYRIGHAYSSDLGSWVRDDQQLAINKSAEGWDSQMMCYPHVFRCDDKIYLLYNGNEFGRHGFGIAELEA